MILIMWFGVVIALLWMPEALLSGIVDVHESGSIINTTAVAGDVAKLVCNITPPVIEDMMTLVIWYKQGLGSPIYSYDSRNKSFQEASHWSDDKIVGGRVAFDLGSRRTPATLTLTSVRDSDGGLYRCRVDFKKSPTRNYNVNLTVIIPPESLAVKIENGDHIHDYVLGPYPEGSSVNLTCVATGGRPPPRVTWWQENALIDETFENLPNRQVRNILRLEKLERKHLNTVFMCQASNNNLVVPKKSEVKLDLILRPLSIRLLGDNKPLSADTKYNITCQVIGARPQPRISWFLSNKNNSLRNSKRIVSEDGNITTSTITFVPTMTDNGKILTCRATAKVSYSSALEHVYEDSWRLNIHYVPLVSLTFGSKLNQSFIREGDDVYFECDVTSNPPIYKSTWRHNGKTVHNNPGVLVSRKNLVLQNITRVQAGLYTCVGSNQEGDGESSPLYLDVKFAPICRPGQETTYGIGRNEIIDVICETEANPTNLTFIWKFKNTSGTATLPSSRFTIEGTRSQAKFKALTELDYGSLSCWARNELGTQLEPCVYHIIPAGRPDPVSNCTIMNQTYDGLSISCESGFDGGLPQEFGMEVYDLSSKELIRNSSGSEAIFTITGLGSGIEYDVRLYAYNAKGRSAIESVNAFTLKSPQKHIGITPTELDLTSLTGLCIAGGVASFFLVCILLFLKVRCRSSSDKKLNKNDLNKQCSNIVENTEKDPDIIPHNEEYLDEDERAFERLNNSTRFFGVQCIRDSYTLPKPLPGEEMKCPEFSISRETYPFDPRRMSALSQLEEPMVYAQIETCSNIVHGDVTQETPLLDGHQHRESTRGNDLVSQNENDQVNVSAQCVATRF